MRGRPGNPQRRPAQASTSSRLDDCADYLLNVKPKYYFLILFSVACCAVTAIVILVMTMTASNSFIGHNQPVPVRLQQIPGSDVVRQPLVGRNNVIETTIKDDMPTGAKQQCMARASEVYSHPIVQPSHSRVTFMTDAINVEFRHEFVVHNAIRFKTDVLVTTSEALFRDLKGLSHLFSEVYIITSLTELQLVAWGPIDGGKEEMVVPAGKPIMYKDLHRSFLYYGTHADSPSIAVKLFVGLTSIQQQSCVFVQALESLAQTRTVSNTAEQRAMMREMVEAVCGELDSFEVYVHFNMLMAHNTPNAWVEQCYLSSGDFPPDDFPIVVLGSYPRSGNHWMRVLLERSTGLFTGSVYGDRRTFESGMLGELYWKNHNDTSRVVAIKDHSVPPLHRYGGKFDKIVHLVRHPFAMAQSYLNFLASGKYNVQANATELDAQKRKLNFILGQWKVHTEYYLSISPMKRLTIRYEDVKDTTEVELKRIIEFLGLEPNIDKIKCAAETSGCAASPAICRAGKTAVDTNLLSLAEQKALADSLGITNLMEWLDYEIG